MDDLQFYDLCHNLFSVTGSGTLLRKVSVAPNARAGQEAGNFDESLMYKRVKIQRKSYLAHRIIFLMTNGYLPELVDHIDGNKLNNDPSNLREATKIQNRWNSKNNASIISGVKGVYKDGSRWKAMLTHKGTKYYLGMFATIEEAGKVVREKYEELQGEFAYRGEIK